MASKAYSGYQQDRAFSDEVRWRLAMPLIYERLGWSSVLMPADRAKHQDMTEGIDYVFRDDRGKLITVQERFREAKYHEYNDFTIRYRRDQSAYQTRQASEFYKLKADIFVYGITNGYRDANAFPTGFLKFAVLDLAFLWQRLADTQIEIRACNQPRCFVENDRLICPIQQNADGSSSFFPVDIQLLVQLWGGGALLMQQGFIV